MGSPVVFAATRTKVLSSKGLLLKSGAIIDNDGKKNYITDGNFDNKLTSSWSLLHTTLLNKVPNQVSASWTAAAGTLTKSLVTTNQLSGTHSLSLASSAATTAGDMLVSSAYTIDREDQGKVLTSSFYYAAAVNPTNNNFSGTINNTWQVYIYDVANSAWIQPSSVYGMTQGTGAGYVTCQWQTPSNMTSFRLAIICCNASTASTTLYFDDFCTCPSQYVYGSPVTDWVAYTPTTTGFGTSSSVQFSSRRVGGNLEVVGRLTPGTLSAVTVQITLGYNGGNGNVTVNNSIIPVNTIVGYGGTARIGPDVIQVMAAGNQNYVTLTPANASISGFSPALGTNFSGSALAFQASIPILGWSSSVQMSDSADTRLLSGSYGGTTSTVTNSAETLLIYNTATSKDTHGSYNTSTGVWTAFKSGTLNVFATYKTAFTATVANADITIKVRLNGANKLAGSVWSPATVAQNYQPKVYGKIDVVAGDQIQFYTTQQAIAGAQTITNDVASTYFTIEEAKGPSAIAATETVAASYWLSANFTSSATIPVNFDSKEYDTHGAVTTSATAWKFTAPISGLFLITGYLQQVTAAAGNLAITLYKSGSSYKIFALQNATITGSNATLNLRLLAGEYIDIRSSVSQAFIGGALATAYTGHVEITRVGN